MARQEEGRNISLVAFYACLLLLAYLVYQIIQPFLVQLGWAVILAVCLDPLQERLQKKLGPTRSAVVLTLLTLVLLVLPLVFAVSALVNEGGQIVANLQTRLAEQGGAGTWLHGAWAFLRERVAPGTVEAVETLGWASDAIEAQAFGFLAARGLKGLPLSYPATTGVPMPMTGGVIARP